MRLSAFSSSGVLFSAFETPTSFVLAEKRVPIMLFSGTRNSTTLKP